MKQTDILRREREIRRAQKKQERVARGEESETPSVGEYINDLAELFFHDNKKIYNIQSEIKILELLEDLKEDHPEKQWDNVLRKAVKKTGITEREEAVKQLKELMGPA
ncbi:MAG: hypothetical protein LBQ61_10025 [Spirochaetales bacterium]|jgi:hypothetical protein|nr:hypothetical protein [Spirochaetales bacterium]